MSRMKTVSLAVVMASVVVAGSALAQSNAPQAAPQVAPQVAPRPAAPATAPAKPAGVASAPSITFEEIVGVPYLRNEYNMWAIGAGAIGGVLAMNAILPSLGVSTVMALPTTTVGLESMLAASRVYAATSAVAGGIVGQMIYDAWR